MSCQSFVCVKVALEKFSSFLNFTESMKELTLGDASPVMLASYRSIENLKCRFCHVAHFAML